MADLLDKIHQEMNFDAYEPALRQIGSVWKEVTALQARVKKMPAAAKQYKAYLKRCIASLKANGADEPALQGAERDLQISLMSERVAQCATELRVHEKAASRVPQDIDEWCAKWLPRELAAVRFAESALIDKPSKFNFTKSWQAIQELLTAYANYIQP